MPSRLQNLRSNNTSMNQQPASQTTVDTTSGMSTYLYNVPTSSFIWLDGFKSMYQKRSLVTVVAHFTVSLVPNKVKCLA